MQEIRACFQEKINSPVHPLVSVPQVAKQCWVQVIFHAPGWKGPMSISVCYLCQHRATSSAFPRAETRLELLWKPKHVTHTPSSSPATQFSGAFPRRGGERTRSFSRRWAWERARVHRYIWPHCNIKLPRFDWFLWAMRPLSLSNLAISVVWETIFQASNIVRASFKIAVASYLLWRHYIDRWEGNGARHISEFLCSNLIVVWEMIARTSEVAQASL